MRVKSPFSHSALLGFGVLLGLLFMACPGLNAPALCRKSCARGTGESFRRGNGNYNYVAVGCAVSVMDGRALKTSNQADNFSLVARQPVPGKRKSR